MHCTVVIPCLGRADLTRACVESLLAQDGNHDLQIVLVDNLGDPATAALTALSPRIEVLATGSNLGFAGACNRGLERARAPFAMVLNNDTVAPPPFLSRLHQALVADDRIGFCAPISNRVKGPAMVAVGDLSATAAGRDRIERELCSACLGLVQDVDTLSGLCLLARTETWRRLGGFDERFVPGNFEDDDLSLRARLAGLRLVLARDAFLHHEAHQSFRALGIDVRDEIRRQHAVFARKWQQDPAGRATLAALDGDLGRAALSAMAAQRVHPEWPEADWILARFQIANGQSALAVPLLQSLVARCPNHAEARLELARCRLRGGEWREGRALLRDTLATCFVARDRACELLVATGDLAQTHGALDEAAEDFAAALAMKPDDPNACNRLGAVRVAQRRFDEALPLLEQAAAMGLALAHTNLGICHYQLGAPEVALEHFRRAAEQLPDDATAQANYETARAAATR